MNSHGRHRNVLFAALLTVAATPVATAEQPHTRESWQALALRGQRIGYGHLVETRRAEDGRDVVQTDMHLHTVMKRFDGKLTLIIDQQVIEDEAGNLLSFTFQMDNPPASHLEMTGRVEGGTLKLQTTAGGNSTETSLDVSDDLKSPVYIDRLLEESPLDKGESRTISLFDPQLGAVVSVKATGQGPATFQLPNGEQQQGLEVVVEYLSGIPGLAVDCFFNPDGESVLNQARLLGTTTWKVTREQALEEIPDDIDIGLSAIIEVAEFPKERPDALTYRISLPSGIPDGLVPDCETQQVERVDANRVDVAVQSIRPSEKSPAPADPPAEKYLAATAMARSDDEQIVSLASESAPESATPSEVAVALEKKVHQWLNRKNMSTNLATASEVVRSREGDCTEHAVLLTALLRARKIPARVAVGLVYWDEISAFAGHAWTEAWVGGRWIPLDATQAKGGIAADHIKLGDSSLSDGDAGLIAGSISTWRLLDKATIEIVTQE